MAVHIPKVILGSNFAIRFLGANITSAGVENIKRANMSHVKIPKRGSRGIGAQWVIKFGYRICANKKFW